MDLKTIQMKGNFNMLNRNEEFKQAFLERKFGKMEFILESNSNIDVNISDNALNTPLHLALLNNLSTLSKLLVKAKANIEAVNFEGKTPLLSLLSSKGEHKWGINFLLSQNANLAVKDIHGHSALYYDYITGKNIIIKEFIKVLDNLNAVNSNPNDAMTLFKKAINSNDLAEVKKCVENYISDINVRDKNGDNILHYLIKHSPGYRLILIKDEPHYKPYPGIDPNNLVKDEPLEILDFLIEKGVNINAQNNLGETPLIMASKFNNENRFNTVWHLIDHGANLLAIDNSGKKAIDYAPNFNNEGLPIQTTALISEIYEFATNPHYKFSKLVAAQPVERLLKKIHHFYSTFRKLSENYRDEAYAKLDQIVKLGSIKALKISNLTSELESSDNKLLYKIGFEVAFHLVNGTLNNIKQVCNFHDWVIKGKDNNIIGVILPEHIIIIAAHMGQMRLETADFILKKSLTKPAVKELVASHKKRKLEETFRDDFDENDKPNNKKVKII